MAHLNLLGIGLLLSFLLLSTTLCFWTSTSANWIYDRPLALAQLSSPITIEQDGDFNTYGFPGSGTANDPYLIRNLWVTGENGITISNVNSHFVITDCILWTQTGISIDNAQNFAIQNTLCRQYDGTEAISISNSDSFLIENITIYPDSIDYYSFEIGIKIIESKNGIVDNCSITNCAIGLEVRSSHNITITDNSIFGQEISYAEGIFLGISNSVISRNYITRAHPCIVLSPGYDNVISDNTCIEGGYGIVAEESHRNEITRNLCNQNIYAGIRISFGSSYNIIRENRMENNDGYGLEFESRWNSIPASNQVFRNIFISNNHAGEQAYDDQGLNGFGYNYWSDWIDQNDENNDGFYDEPYPIAGSSIFDNYPLVNESLAFSLSIDSVSVPINTEAIKVMIIVLSLFAIPTLFIMKRFIDVRRNKKSMEGGATSTPLRDVPS